MLKVLVVDERLADPELLGGRPHELLRQARPHRHRVLDVGQPRRRLHLLLEGGGHGGHLARVAVNAADPVGTEAVREPDGGCGETVGLSCV